MKRVVTGHIGSEPQMDQGDAGRKDRMLFLAARLHVPMVFGGRAEVAGPF